MNPGPATETLSIPSGKAAFILSTISAASSRGDQPASFAVANATFEDQSPWSYSPVVRE